MEAGDQQLVHTPFVPSGYWSSCAPLVWNPVKAPDIRFSSSHFRKQHPRHEKATLSLNLTIKNLPYRSNPDYYEAVREPMDLARIQAKIKACEYESVDQMATDVNLIVANTKAFYPASTTEFAKAVELQDVFDHERQVLQSITTKSTDSTTSSTSSSVTDRRATRRRPFVTEERDEEEVC
ncbi:unnamed protein product [Schistosoma margrebowiei]|uniref:Uncharacterized protein n=1 Tax=Schistosoma margrebowiei TaxID=48269 RepID=A0A183MBP7_9TREM|nr:unnamed protein product [Schistosoma margrebowiei]